MKSFEIPQFGLLTGVKVVMSGSSVAGPFAASLMADHGADVTFIESPIAPDVLRAHPDGAFQKERKNSRNLVLNIPSPEGKEILFRLLKNTDVLIENGKGGQWAKWGLTDDILWQANPKLVITHVSGYGQSGLPEFYKRGSWDSIGQAFGGYMNLNGEPAPAPPSPAAPFTADYMTALMAYGTTLAALINAQRTGKGESLDISQFETMATCQMYLEDYLNYGVDRKRMGSLNAIAGWQSFECKDGLVFVCCVGASAMRKGLPFLGLDPQAPEYKGKGMIARGEPGSQELIDTIAEYCKDRTVEEVDRDFNMHGISASPIMDFDMMASHPHYIARETLTEWELWDGSTFKSTNVLPKVKNNPGQVWRPAPKFGMDNDDILEELGYTQSQIDQFYENKILDRDKSLVTEKEPVLS